MTDRHTAWQTDFDLLTDKQTDRQKINNWMIIPNDINYLETVINGGPINIWNLSALKETRWSEKT